MNLLYRLDGNVKGEAIMVRDATDTRQRILAAAETIAREAGPGNLSLDAVAACAGVSKGGLLYHFKSKNALMEALVHEFCNRFDVALRNAGSEGEPDGVIAAYVLQFLKEREARAKPPSGLLAALAEDPELLDPVRIYERDFLERIRANASDKDQATVVFLVINGIRSMELLNCKVLNDNEEREVLDYLARCLPQMGAKLPDISEY